MRDAMEMMMFRQTFATTESWTQAVFLAGVFLIVLFRRDQIFSPYMFRVSVILFVLSLIVPVVIAGIVHYAGTTGGGIGGPGMPGAFLQVLMTATGPVLLGLAVLLCVLSMLPPQSRYPGPPERPVHPHPLD